MKIGSLSGSITKTNDGLSYLVAGTNVTITSASNGSVTIASTGGGGTPGGSNTQVQYNNAGSFAGSSNFTYDGSLQITGSVIQANIGANTVGFMGNEIGSSPTTIGSDVFFFVSGSRNSEVSAFGGDLVVSGTVSIGGDSLEVTGTISATQGFSGSLTKLVDGTSYLVAGTNVTITSASNGSVTVDAVGGTPGGSDTEIQYNNAGSFTGSSNFKYDGIAVFLSGSLVNGSGSLVASGLSSHIEGWGNMDSYGASQASGDYSHAEGESTTASGIASHAEGHYTAANGNHSHAEGFLTNASAQYSHAEGSSTTASGYASHAEGVGTSTSANFTHAEGNGTSASQEYAHAEGVQTTASGYGSHSEGNSTTASGDRSHAEGSSTISSGLASHAEGYGTTAISDYSHAEGHGTSSGYKGFNTTNITAGVVTLNSSYGDVTTSFTGIGAGNYALLTWISEQDIAYEISSVTWDGTNTIVTLVDTSINDVRPGLIGIRGVTLPGGANVTNTGISSHAEGYQTYAQPRYSHAEGYQTVALAVRSHAEGEGTTTIGVGSHSEGLGTIASGSYQHVGGKYNIRNNNFSLLVVGNGTSAADVDRSDVFRINSGSVGDGRVEVTGSFAATTGLSGSLTQLVDGTSYLVAGANVTISSASNGSVTISSAGGSGSPGGSDTEIQYNSAGSFAGSSNFTYNGSTVFLTGSFSQGNGNIVHGLNSHAEGYDTLAVGSYSHAEGGTGGGGQLIASGTYSHAEGYNTVAYAAGTHTEGTTTIAGALGYHSTSISSGVITLDASYGDVTSTGTMDIMDGTYIVLNDYDYSNNYPSSIYKVDTSVWNGTNTVLTLFDLGVTTTEAVIGVVGAPAPTYADYPLGQYSHAEGYNTLVMGIGSHAEGSSTTASGFGSHAEGQGTNARGFGSHAEGTNTAAYGSFSHAEGYFTIALGDHSHAEGAGTQAVGDYSHAEGLETIASGSYQHAGGKYNKRNNNFSLLVVGNGTSDIDDDRSDIFRVNTDSVQVSGSLIVSGAYIHNVVSGTTAPNYTVGTWDHVIVFSNNVVTATLPPAAPIGRKLIFKDGTGAASTAGGQMLSCSLGAIDGAPTYTMASVNYTAVSVIKINDPDEWIIV